MASGIYLITNLKNQKVYVGQAIELSRRLGEHKSRLNGKRHQNKHLQRAWNKYGENSFVFEVIENSPVETLGLREGYWINEFRALEPQFGYNSDFPTEDGGKITSEKTRRKQSVALMGFKRSQSNLEAFRRAWADGKRDREQTRAMGKSHAKPFSLLAPNGQLVTGTNLNDFCMENNLNQGNLANVLLGKRTSHKGFRAVTGGVE